MEQSAERLAANDCSDPDRDAWQRLKRETLVSFVIVSGQDPTNDCRAVLSVADFAEGSFEYYEIVLVAAQPTAPWRARILADCLRVKSLRIVTIDAPMGYEELSTAALRFPIGDLIVSLHPGEIGPEDIRRLIGACASGNADLVKAFPNGQSLPASERLAARAIRWGMRLATGRDVQAFQARAFAIKRPALSRLQAIGGAMRYFRVLDLAGLVTEGRIEIDAGPRRRVLGGFAEKLRIASILISSSSGRLILWLAIVCALLSFLSIGVALLAFVIWLAFDHVAPGWTSLAVVLSSLFAANFAVLSAICLGLLQIIRQATPDPVELFATEVSGGDLFERSNRLNVEGVLPPELPLIAER
jgi:hypothetical protein